MPRPRIARGTSFVTPVSKLERGWCDALPTIRVGLLAFLYTALVAQFASESHSLGNCEKLRTTTTEDDNEC